jgi:elongation factor P
LISASGLKSGMVFEMNGKLYQVVEARHYKPGKGSAFMRTRIKDMDTSSIIDHKFRTDEKINRVILDQRPATYLYKDGEKFVFMDNETYEQIYLNESDIGENINFLLENQTIEITFYEEKPISIEMPIFVELEVVEAKPGVKGDTQSGGSKPITVETGYKLRVPLFIDKGDRIKIDTRTGEYVERVK